MFVNQHRTGAEDPPVRLPENGNHTPRACHPGRHGLELHQCVPMQPIAPHRPLDRTLHQHGPHLPGRAQQWCRSGDLVAVHCGGGLLRGTLFQPAGDQYPRLVSGLRADVRGWQRGGGLSRGEWREPLPPWVPFTGGLVKRSSMGPIALQLRDPRAHRFHMHPEGRPRHPSHQEVAQGNKHDQCTDKGQLYVGLAEERRG